MVTTRHKENYNIVGNSHLDGSSHDQTIICWQLFAGRVFDSLPMVRKKMYRMIICLPGNKATSTRKFVITPFSFVPDELYSSKRQNNRLLWLNSRLHRE